MSRKNIFQETCLKYSEENCTSHCVLYFTRKSAEVRCLACSDYRHWLSELDEDQKWGKKFFMPEESWRRKGLPQYLVLTTFPICQESQDLEVFCFLCYGFHAVWQWASSKSVSFNLTPSYLLRYGLVEMAFQLQLQWPAWMHLTVLIKSASRTQKKHKQTNPCPINRNKFSHQNLALLNLMSFATSSSRTAVL